MFVQNKINIVLIEDNDGQALLIKKNLVRSGFKNKITVLRDGQEGIDFIFREGASKGFDKSTPMVILLDLNLPKITGLQILKRVKENTQTRHIPVIILTTSADPNEVKKCYDHGCNFFLTKPVDYQEFSDTIQVVANMIKVAKIPSYGAGK